MMYKYMIFMGFHTGIGLYVTTRITPMDFHIHFKRRKCLVQCTYSRIHEYSPKYTSINDQGNKK